MLIAAFFGLFVGSFVNVVALRWFAADGGQSKSAWGGRSQCPRCGKTLRWFELLPLVSFGLQRGRCRGCQAKISWRYPLVELGFGVLLALVAWARPPLEMPLPFALAAVYFCLLGLLFLLDLDRQVVPDVLAWLAILFGVMATGLTWRSVGLGILAGVFVPLAIVAVTRRKGMGEGDILLGAAAGAFLGWPLMLDGWLWAFCLGAVVGLGLMLLGRAGRKTAIPFGPFIAVSVLLVWVLANMGAPGFLLPLSKLW